MRKFLLSLGLLLFGLMLVLWALAGPDWRRLIKNMPTNSDVLFWSQDQREAGFRMMDRVSFMIKARDIDNGSDVKPLPDGEPVPDGLKSEIDRYMNTNQVASLVILQGGKIRHEQYGLNFDAEGRWTSFSVAKSFTSTMVGAAIEDGHIDSLDDPVSKYITGLKGSAYDDVTIEQLLTMSSGVRWIEDYTDPNSDVALFNAQEPEDGNSSLVTYMRKLPRAHPPGEVWNYSTGETNLIGVLIRETTGKTLADYLSEKVWAPYGMEGKATWLLSPDGEEISGCCIQATTRDFARFGQFIMDGALIDGKSIVPEGWIESATSPLYNSHHDGQSYGYQWWVNPDGTYEAMGIFGQGIFIDQKRQLVIASNGNWTSAVGYENGERGERNAFYKNVQQALSPEVLEHEVSEVEVEISDPVHVGGPVTSPKPISKPQPPYTEAARKARVQGVVIAQIVVETDGTVSSVKILKGLPMGLGESAAETIKRWKFEPATLDGEPVRVFYNVTANFRLQ